MRVQPLQSHSYKNTTLAETLIIRTFDILHNLMLHTALFGAKTAAKGYFLMSEYEQFFSLSLIIVAL
jgi:hypothetical protein